MEGKAYHKGRLRRLECLLKHIELRRDCAVYYTLDSQQKAPNCDFEKNSLSREYISRIHWHGGQSPL